MNGAMFPLSLAPSSTWTRFSHLPVDGNTHAFDLARQSGPFISCSKVGRRRNRAAEGPSTLLDELARPGAHIVRREVM